MSNRTKISFTKKEVKDILEGKVSSEELLELIKDRLQNKEFLLKRNSIFEKERRSRLSKKSRGLNREKELGQVAEEFRSDLIAKQTNAEKTFKALLKALKIEYEFQKIFYTPTKFYILDFYIPNKKVGFEIDGEYHNNTDQKLYDITRTNTLKTLNIKEIYRFTNKDVLENSLFVEDRIKELKINE